MRLLMFLALISGSSGVWAQGPPPGPPQLSCAHEEFVTCESLFGDVKTCGDKPCHFEITGWQQHPTKPLLEIPIIEYKCGIVAPGEPTIGAHEVDRSTYLTCSDVEQSEGFSEQEWDQQVVCWTLKVCSLSCTRTAEYLPPNKWPVARAKPGYGGTVPAIPVYEARCNDGVSSGDVVEFWTTSCVGDLINCLDSPPAGGSGGSGASSGDPSVTSEGGGT